LLLAPKNDSMLWFYKRLRCCTKPLFDIDYTAFWQQFGGCCLPGLAGSLHFDYFAFYWGSVD